jgi:hypothetical protein
VSLTEISQLSAMDLLQLHVGIMDELYRRGIIRSGNNPTGDLAEYMFCKAFDWTQANNANANIDAVAADGRRYQIQERRITPRGRSRQLGAIRDLAGGHFDFLAGILFAENYSVYRAALIPHAVVIQRAAFVTRTNSHKFILHDDVWSAPGVDDVTDRFAR